MNTPHPDNEAIWYEAFRWSSPFSSRLIVSRVAAQHLIDTLGSSFFYKQIPAGGVRYEYPIWPSVQS